MFAERMHLLTFMQMKNPGPLFRAFVLLTQVRLPPYLLQQAYCVHLCSAHPSPLRLAVEANLLPVIQGL